MNWVKGSFWLGLSIALSLFLSEVITWTVETTGFSWVVTSIVMRLLVIVFLSLFIRRTLLELNKGKTWKYYIFFLIALLPGFGLSFLTPIYETDYGMWDDELELAEHDQLPKLTFGSFRLPEERHIIAFFSTDCDHCQLVSEKLGSNQRAGQEIPVHAFFSGTKENADRFMQEHKGEQFQQHFIPNDSIFLAYSGYSFPSVFLMEPNGEVIYHWSGDLLNYTALDKLK